VGLQKKLKKSGKHWLAMKTQQLQWLILDLWPNTGSQSTKPIDFINTQYSTELRRSWRLQGCVEATNQPMTVGHQTSPKLPRFAEFLSAFFSMTQAEYAAGNFKQKATEGQLMARIRVGAGIDNVAGVKLSVFSKYDTGIAADNQSLGLVGGGKKIVAVREKFTVLLELLLKYVILFALTTLS
jgi:hypothetical protein